jgi:hypothetical protein
MRKYVIKCISSSSLLGNLYIFFSGLAFALKYGKVVFLAKTWFSRENIIIYCNQSGHIGTVSDIVKVVSKKRKVCVLLSFEENPPLDWGEYVTVERNFKQSCIALLSAKVFVTPVVGFPSNYRPFFSQTIHLMISLGSIASLYRKDHFDGYDHIFCAGPRQIEDLTKLFRSKSLSDKKLIKGGYPKLDSQIRKHSRSSHKKSNGNTIIYAPTHRVSGVNDDSVSLRDFGKNIISILLDADFNVLFRPHPVSFTDSDKQIIEEIEREFSENDKYSLDTSTDYMQSYSCSDVLLTDISGTAFTYAFTFLRPVIFFVPQEAASVRKSEFYTDCLEIGNLVHEVNGLPSTCSKLLDNRENIEKISSFRSRFIYNQGRSAEYFASCVDTMLGETKESEWVPLE